MKVHHVTLTIDELGRTEITDPASLGPGVYEALVIPRATKKEPVDNWFAEASLDVFSEIWDNEEDAVYDRYLPQ